MADVAAICRDEKRPDLERAVRIAAARLARTDTVVCLVGEYKKGKSTLVNAILGTDVCPVEDDFATSALTVISYAEAPIAKVHGMGANGRTIEEIGLERAAEFVSERSNPANEKRIDLVEIGVPNELLRDGLSIVDTPGIGGFGRAYAAAIFGFLPVVDGLVFVTDASAPLNAQELRFFIRARQACPTVLLALTKTDLHASWREILEIDRGHLSDGAVETFPLAAPLRRRALAARDQELDDESGYPTLLASIRRQIVGRTQSAVLDRTMSDAARALNQLASPIGAELRALEDPSQGEALSRQLAEAEQRARELRDAGARWAVTLSDGFSDLRTELDQRLREVTRRRLQEAEREIEKMDPVVDWDRYMEGIRTQLIEDAYACFEAAHDAAEDVAKRIGQTIGEETSPLADVRAEDVSASLAPRDPGRPEAARSAPGRLEWGLGMLRGAQGGGYTIAWATGIVGITVAAPVALGAGALFAAKFVLDERKRQTERRRQEARTALKQYIDTLQFELGRRLQQNLNVLQRTLRDHFQTRMQELSTAQTETVRALQASLGADQSARKARQASLRSRHERLVKTHAALRRPLAQG
ncbi:MAG TPA: dynamin family protein [Candidatus Limnocylindria bacterium]|nr:dynamin family protein [Candidatus Limnocylindria bacterium]